MLLAFVVQYVYFSVNVEDAISQEGEYATGLSLIRISEASLAKFVFPSTTTVHGRPPRLNAQIYARYKHI